MLKAYLITGEGADEQPQFTHELVGSQEKGSILWVDLRDYSGDEVNQVASAFKLHSIETDSLCEEYTRPHIFEYEDHLHVNFTYLDFAKDGLLPHEFHVFLGGNYIITASTKAGGEMIDEVLNTYRATPKLADRGAYYALYLISDLLVDTYIHAADDMDDQVDNLEDEMSDNANRETLQHLFEIKRQLFDLRRYLGPQRDVFNQLSRGAFHFVEDAHEPYFQDVYNRMSRVFDVMDTSRDILSGTLDLYQSSVSNRLNDIMKVLTILAVILGVFSFLTGFFGMNLFEPAHYPMKVVALWSFIIGVVITAILMYFFRRKNWL